MQIELSDNIQYIDIPRLTVGVLSDTQLSPFGTKADIFDANFVSALQVCKRNNCGVVIVAGDIANLGYANSYKRYNRALDQVYGSTRPLMLNIMGNHDYYRLGSASRCRQLFVEGTSSPLCAHYCINGYHFVTASPSSKSMHSGYKGHLQWLRHHLDRAVASSGSKPVFVVTHMCGTGTVYGSDGWGDSYLRELLDSYPTVVNFGGHSHYSLLDERSIWQGSHTAVNTQSLSYVELDADRANGSVPPQSYAYPLGIIMKFEPYEIQLRRVSMLDGTEQKPAKRWTLPIAIDSHSYTYTDSRVYGTPTISGSGHSSVSDGVTSLHFRAGYDSDFVHSYRVEFVDIDKGYTFTQCYFSDFYLGIESMAVKVQLPLYGVPRGRYNVRVYAINSGGIASRQSVAIYGVCVSRKVKYSGVTSPVHKFSGI